MEKASQKQLSQGHHWLLWAAALGSFLPPFLGSSLNVALPVIGRELHATGLELGFIVNAFLIVAAGMLVPFARWADTSSRARIFALGLLGQALASAAAVFARSVPAMLLVRAGQGAAAAATFATAAALVTQMAPSKKKGKLLGANTAAVYLGLTLGPPAGGFLTEHLGWRSIFTASTALALAGWVLIRHGSDDRTVKAERKTPWNLWLFALGVSCVLGGLAMARVQQGFYALAVAGAAAVGLSFRVSTAPPVEPALFRNAAFTFSNLAALVHYAATFSVSLFLALYLQLVGGLSPRTTGLLLLAQPLLMALLSPGAGALSDRWEPRWVASAGMGLTVAGLLTLSPLRAQVSLSRVVLGLVLLGLGFALFSSPNTHAVMGQAPCELLAAASATLALSRLTGQAASLILASFFLPKGPLEACSVAGLVSGMRGHLLVASFFCVVGIGFSLARGRVHGGGSA